MKKKFLKRLSQYKHHFVSVIHRLPTFVLNLAYAQLKMIFSIIILFYKVLYTVLYNNVVNALPAFT